MSDSEENSKKPEKVSWKNSKGLYILAGTIGWVLLSLVIAAALRDYINPVATFVVVALLPATPAAIRFAYYVKDDASRQFQIAFAVLVALIIAAYVVGDAASGSIISVGLIGLFLFLRNAYDEAILRRAILKFRKARRKARRWYGKRHTTASADHAQSEPTVAAPEQSDDATVDNDEAVDESVSETEVKSEEQSDDKAEVKERRAVQGRPNAVGGDQTVVINPVRPSTAQNTAPRTVRRPASQSDERARRTTSRMSGNIPDTRPPRIKSAGIWLNGKWVATRTAQSERSERRAESRRVEEVERTRQVNTPDSGLSYPQAPPVQDPDASPSQTKKSRNKTAVTLVVVSLIALVALAMTGGGYLLYVSGAKDGAAVAAEKSQKALSSASDQLAKSNADADQAKKDKEAAEAKAKEATKAKEEAEAEPKAQPVSYLTELTVDQRKIAENWNAAGGNAQNDLRFGEKIDYKLARSIDAGGSTFGDAVYTNTDAVKLMSSTTPEAKAAFTQWKLTNSGCSTSDALDSKQWTSAQSMTSTKWNGNTYFLNGSAVDGGSKVDPAGTVAVFFTGECGNSTKLFSLRGACANPQLQMWTPVRPFIPAVYTPPSGGGNPPKPICTQANDCKPVNPPVVCIDKPNKPCNPTPCVEQPGKPCNPTPCVDQPDKPCNPNPPTEKCKGKTLDELCADPNPATSQPVGDNDGKDAPTTGYKDNAETVTNNQPNCQLASCGLDTMVDGTHVSGSQTGPGIPNAGTQTPSTGGTNGSGATNPNSDGSVHTTNPAQGMSDPGQSSSSGQTTTAGSSDSFQGVPLPNADTSSHSDTSSTVSTSTTSTTSSTAGDTTANASSTQAPSTADYELAG